MSTNQPFNISTDPDDDLPFVQLAPASQVVGHSYPTELGPQHDAHADAWLDALDLHAPSGYRAGADSDGYTDGQRDRALVLDYFACLHTHGYGAQASDHEANLMDPRSDDAACDTLVAQGLLHEDWLDRGASEKLTSAGHVAHAAARRALADLDAKIAALPRGVQMVGAPR